MSRIADLIETLCPDGVPHRTLGELVQISSARVDIATLGAANYVGVDNLLPNFGGRRDSDHLPNTGGAIGFEPGDLLIGNIRPYLRKVWFADRTGGASPDVLTVALLPSAEGVVMPKFLYFLIASEAFIGYSMQHAKGAKMPRGDKAATLRYRVPVPPPEVQREIVRTLDVFTELEAELEAELESRRKQYAHYRDTLMTFSDPERERERERVRWLTLGEVGSFRRGSGIQKSDFRDSGVGCIHYGQIHTRFGPWTSDVVSYIDPAVAKKLPMAQPGDLIIATTSEDDGGVAKAVAWMGASQVAVSTDAYVYRHSLDPKFVAYFFESNSFQTQKRRYITGTKVRRISGEALGRMNIPMPSMAEQRRIVTILDDFDALVNDLSIGLPAELAARRKQYEYYRDRLLTFKEAA